MPFRTRVTLFALALAVRLFFFATHGPILSADSEHYLSFARNLAGQHIFTEIPPMPSVRRPPLYPAFLAMTGRMPNAAVSIQCAFDSFTAVAVGELALLATTLPYAIAVAALYAVYPGAIEFSSRVLTEIPFTFLVTLSLLLVSRARFLSGGVAFGLSILCRPFAVALLATGTIVVYLSRKPKSFKPLGLLALGCMLMVTPWLIRCAAVARAPVFVQVGTGQMLYVPTLLKENQTDWAKLYQSDPLLHRFFYAPTAPEMVADEHELTHQAIRNIRTAPSAYLKSRLHYFPYLFLSSFDSVTGIKSTFGDAFREHRWLALVVKGFIILIFGVLPLCVAIFGIRRAPLCSSAWIVTALLQAPMYIEQRFWLPVVPALFVSAAGGIYRLKNRRFPTQSPKVSCPRPLTQQQDDVLFAFQKRQSG